MRGEFIDADHDSDAATGTTAQRFAAEDFVQIAIIADLLGAGNRPATGMKRDFAVFQEQSSVDWRKRRAGCNGLYAAGAWSVAAEISREATERLSDTTWDRPRKLRSASRQVAAEIESAAASNDFLRIKELTASWCQLDRETKQDDEANKKRDTLFGISLPNSGD